MTKYIHYFVEIRLNDGKWQGWASPEELCALVQNGYIVIITAFAWKTGKRRRT